MLIDRISLANAFGALQKTELNEGKISQILFNKSAKYGTKTQKRFESINAMRDFINNEFPFQLLYIDCQCGTCNEAVWQLLGFTIELPNRRFISFINNMRGQFESAEGYLLNKISKDALSEVFLQQSRLNIVKNNYECSEYIQNQGRYVSPCEYIDVEYNNYYTELIQLYNKTKGIPSLTKEELFVNDCYENQIDPKAKWDDSGLAYPTTTTTTTAAPTTTTTLAPTTTAAPTTTTAAPTTTTAVPTTTSTTTQLVYNRLVMSNGFGFNGAHWQTANNGGSYDNTPGALNRFAFAQTLTNGLLDTTLIQNLLDDAYVFEQDPQIFTWPQLTLVAYGGATYIGSGIGQVQVGQQLYDGTTTNPWTNDTSSGFQAGAAQVSLIQGGENYVQQASDDTLQNEENRDWQQNGGTVRVIAWDDNGIITDVQDFTVPLSSTTTTTTN